MTEYIFCCEYVFRNESNKYSLLFSKHFQLKDQSNIVRNRNHFHICVLSMETISLAYHEDWQQGETASPALSKVQ